jgi:hypothetical protein
MGHKARFLTDTKSQDWLQIDSENKCKIMFDIYCGSTIMNSVAKKCIINYCLIFRQFTWRRKMEKPTIGQKIKMPVYGKLQTVTVLAVHPFGTIDIETESGACFRITGLSFI